MLTQPSTKYRRLPAVNLTDRTWPDRVIERPPIWCSVDLRDGNQALIEPMNQERKRRMFDLLVRIGFKEIEAGFPSASQTDFDFIRHLIVDNVIPDDVTIQVLTQAREHLIERTFESLAGAKRAIVHVYNATAPVMRKVVFGMSRDEVVDLAVTHCRMIKRLAGARPETDWIFQYSPEMFSGTEIDFSKQIVDAVVAEFGATPERKIIINLPSTVECSSPNIFADQIEWMHRNLAQRDSMVLSVHPHNDRGTGTAAAEFAMMAGVDRVEGCLFGNGERTGNVDIVNLAINMYAQGVNPGLDFSDIDEIRREVEYCNQRPVHCRHPYVGDLVYTSFSGSHQDAIKKAFAARKEGDIWDMPYLPIDPMDLGRSYEAVIRVNSQSGKGGIAYLLQHEYGVDLPRRMQIEFSAVVQKVTDETGSELSAGDLWRIFSDEYLGPQAPLALLGHESSHRSAQGESVEVNQLRATVRVNSQECVLQGDGSGPIDAFVAALSEHLGRTIEIMDYHEHAIGAGSDAKAASYVELRVDKGRPVHGVGMSPDIVTASLRAIISALNRIARESGLAVRKAA
ncbi:MAG: 2-isopropylmalate synthase [Betaproteobacteria bacterium]